MSEQTPEQRIAILEAQVQSLAEDYAEQVYGHTGPVYWEDDPEFERGWTRDVTPASRRDTGITQEPLMDPPARHVDVC